MGVDACAITHAFDSIPRMTSGVPSRSSTSVDVIFSHNANSSWPKGRRCVATVDARDVHDVCVDACAIAHAWLVWLPAFGPVLLCTVVVGSAFLTSPAHHAVGCWGSGQQHRMWPWKWNTRKQSFYRFPRPEVSVSPGDQSPPAHSTQSTS